MKVIFDDSEFDRVVHGSLPECGEDHFAIVVKDNGTVGGNPIACITFVSMTPVGPKRVQMVTTVRNLISALAVLEGKYEYLARPKQAPENTPKQLSGHVDGIGWNAAFFERIYLVSCENGMMGFAATEEDVKAVAVGLCKPSNPLI